MQRICFRRLKVCFCLLASLLLVLSMLSPVGAVLAASDLLDSAHGLMMQKFQMTLVDLADRPWNLSMFKKAYPDGVENLQLRIVGQLATDAIAANQPLILANDTGLRLEAANVTAEVFNPSLDEGQMQQFNLQPVFNQVRASDEWELQFWTENKAFVELPIPAKVIQQWQMVAACQGLVCEQ